MSTLRILALSAALAIAPVVAASGPDAVPESRAKVMIVGLFHFANPGQDMFNVRMDDVLAPRRQAELAALVENLAAFVPDAVMVEASQARTDDRFAAYRAGTLAPSRNEVDQLGFRLAARAGLERVHGIDVGGDFAFGPVMAFAQAHGSGARLEAAMAEIGREVDSINGRIASGSIGSVLGYMNDPGRLRHHHGFYIDLLRQGEGGEQPGVALVSAWYARNLGICARLLQALPAAGRAVVFYGEGHAYLLRQCVAEVPGVELVEPAAYLEAR